MIDCKDQTQNAPNFDSLVDWDAFSKSDEMEVLTPESTSTSFSTHEPYLLRIPTEDLIPKYYTSGSMSPMTGSPSYEAFRHEYECISGSGSANMSPITPCNVQPSNEAPGLLNRFPGQAEQFNIVHEPAVGQTIRISTGKSRC